MNTAHFKYKRGQSTHGQRNLKSRRRDESTQFLLKGAVYIGISVILVDYVGVMLLHASNRDEFLQASHVPGNLFRMCTTAP